MALEEMIAANEDEFLGLGDRRDQFFQSIVRTILIVVAADKQLGLGASVQERVRIKPTLGFHRRTN